MSYISTRMAGLYDLILHRRFSSTYARPLFKAGLAARQWWFALRETAGTLISGRPLVPSLDAGSISRLLLIRTDRIGDIVLTAPLLHALRERFPQARIDFLVQQRYAALLDCYPGWTNIIPISNVLDTREIRRIGDSLRAASYDVVFVLHPSAYASRLARLSQAAWRIGWKAKGYGYTLTHAFADDRSTAKRHQVENNLKLLGPLNITVSRPVFQCTVTPSGESEVDSLLQSLLFPSDKKMILLSPGSYSPRVRWLPERYAELADRVHGAGGAPLLLGGPSDADAIEAVRAASRCRPAIAQGLSLPAVVSLCRRAAAFVGNSSGPLHIAASLGVPAVGIFGPRYGLDRYELWAPYGKSGTVVSAPPDRCRECLPWTCPDLRCMREVTVDMVWEKIKSYF